MITCEQIETTRDRVASYILSTADYSRADRLWPAHYLVFSTNPLSIAYGASGISLFLRQVLGNIPSKVRAWLLDRELTVEDYPPGLLVGTAGIAYAYFEIGLTDKAEEVIATCYRSPLLFHDPTMFMGAAGWGLISLYFYRQTGRTRYLDQVDRATNLLIQSARHVNDTCYWPYSLQDRVHYGYGYGASGIALFLLRAGLALGRDDAIDVARRALDFDLTNRHEDTYGWTWTDVEGGSRFLRYWEHGSAGVGSTAIRFYHALEDEKYREIAEIIADGASTKWTILPNLLTGLTGIAEFMFDMYLVTNRSEYLDRTLHMTDTVLWYAIDRPAGIAFPGRWLGHISNDYATGSAGIGLFLDRLLQPRSRHLIDVDFDIFPNPQPRRRPFPMMESLWRPLAQRTATSQQPTHPEMPR